MIVVDRTHDVSPANHGLIDDAAMLAHLGRLLFFGDVLRGDCEICRQIAAELCVSLPREQGCEE